jgi:hypothetical protein
MQHLGQPAQGVVGESRQVVGQLGRGTKGVETLFIVALNFARAKNFCLL